MHIPLVDLKRQYNRYKMEIDDAIKEVIDQTAFIGGSFVKKFEEEFAGFTGRKYCVGCGNGTDAIFLGLLAFGVGHGDEVIVPSHTFVATVEAVSATGAMPVFCDIEEKYYTIDPTKISKMISDKTKAIIGVHLYGQPCNMEKISKIAEDNNIYLLEDCAQAHNAFYKDKMIGTFGDAACFSFFPGKNLGAYGDAGAVVTDRKEIYDTLIALRNHGRKNKFESYIVGYNSRLDGLQASILSAKLKHITEWSDERRKAAKLYDELLSDISQITIPEVREDCEHVYHLYVIRVKADREEFMNYLKKEGIMCSIHYPIPCHKFTPYKNCNGADNLRITEEVTGDIVSLPIFAEIQETEIRYISDKIKQYFIK